MLSMTSLAVENEVAYRRHEFERAARRDAVRRYRNDRNDARRIVTRSNVLSQWRRYIRTHGQRRVA